MYSVWVRYSFVGDSFSVKFTDNQKNLMYQQLSRTEIVGTRAQRTTDTHTVSQVWEMWFNEILFSVRFSTQRRGTSEYVCACVCNGMWFLKIIYAKLLAKAYTRAARKKTMKTQ